MSFLRLTILCLFSISSIVVGDLPVFWEEEYAEDLSPELKYSPRDVAYRLPQNIIPTDYDVDIEFYFNGPKTFTYDGKVTINIQVTEANSNEIVLHANVDNINSVILKTENDIIVPTSFKVDEKYHFLRINTADFMPLGQRYILTIEYSSTMNETPLTRGIWRGRYVDDEGIERIYVTTHFQPYNARQAFPCWDEPSFKAVFTLHLTRPLRYESVFSNTGVKDYDLLSNERRRDNFNPTPKMSTYLVTFLVSETFTVIAEDSKITPPIRLIAKSNAKGRGAHAFNLLVRMTAFFEKYLDYSYSSLHPNLYNDHVASPDWASAGTENWGMVSYRELHLLIDYDETVPSVEHYGATLITHELAHKWFGNLVTCFWWSNTWINEGFASYFGYMATHQVFPQYEMHEHFNSRYLQTSLSVDASSTTPALNHEVNTPPQITGHFGTISYSKGAAFMRMIANLITEDTFRKACQYFLQDNKYKPANQQDLLDAFVKAINEDNTLNEYRNLNFTTFYYNWVDTPGYPILTVNINTSNGEMHLFQDRFYINPDTPTSEEIYQIPITYSTKSNPRFYEVKPVYVFETKRAVLTLEKPTDEWVIFNNLQHGHYRVTYDKRNWELIAEALIKEPNTIHHLNRAQIVDDVFALMRSRRLDFNFGINILKFLKNETNYHVWNPAISGYTWIRNRLRHLHDDREKFDKLILSYMDYIIDILGFDVESKEESITVSLTRQEVLQFACNLRHERCVQETKKQFLKFKNNERLSPRIRRSAYMEGIREGNEEDYYYLLRRMRDSNLSNDQLEMLRALATTRIPALLNEYLKMTLGNEVRAQDKVTAFNFALQGNPESAAIVLKFVIDNIDAIRKEYVAEAPNTPVHTALSNLASYLDEEGLKEMEQWLKNTQSESAQFSSALTAIGTARSNMAWGDKYVDEIMEAIKGGSAQIFGSAILIVSLISITMTI